MGGKAIKIMLFETNKFHPELTKCWHQTQKAFLFIEPDGVLQPNKAPDSNKFLRSEKHRDLILTLIGIGVKFTNERLGFA